MTQTNTYSEVNEWLGIQYATAKRFQKPELVKFDPDKTYDKPGPASIQNIDLSWLGTDRMSEDECLNLNIWAPKNIDHPLPVVVYIHGGGWSMGSNSQEMTRAAGLAKTGKVIAVSINYRLGAMGWLELAQFGGRFKDASNLGLQDVIASLDWIQKNIARFGGDPGNVTLTGHSGGAFNSLAMLTAPNAKGKFHHIAAFSGVANRTVPQWYAEEIAHNVLSKLNCEHNPERLFELDAKELNQILNDVVPAKLFDHHVIDNTWIGITDDSLLPNGVLSKTPMEAIEAGDNSDIDIIFSSATAEVDWFILNNKDAIGISDFDELEEKMVKQFRIARSRVRKIINAYTKDGYDAAQVTSDFLTDFGFFLPQLRASIAHAKNGGRSYLLNVGPAEGSPAVHGTEMYGIVGAKQANASEEQLQRDQAVTDAVINLATGNFDQLWQPMTADEIHVKEIGQRPYDTVSHAHNVEKLFKGIIQK